MNHSLGFWSEWLKGVYMDAHEMNKLISELRGTGMV